MDKTHPDHKLIQFSTVDKTNSFSPWNLSEPWTGPTHSPSAVNSRSAPWTRPTRSPSVSVSTMERTHPFAPWTRLVRCSQGPVSTTDRESLIHFLGSISTADRDPLGSPYELNGHHGQELQSLSAPCTRATQLLL